MNLEGINKGQGQITLRSEVTAWKGHTKCPGGVRWEDRNDIGSNQRV
jgi:hypothetical protein